MGGLFLLLNATFLAVLQIIIYAGAVMALFLFVIMMVDIPDEATPAKFHLYGKLALLLILLIAGATIWSIRTMNHQFSALTADFSVRELSRHIFTTHLFPFEAIGILIVSAVVGALYIARKEAA
jgi:NADH-quinone oxidoreductase subunit J